MTTARPYRAAPSTQAQFAPVRDPLPPPTYAIESVDNVLRLLMMLRRDGVLRVSTAADELGVARSTAHRLLAMLLFREFAVQQPDRSYRPGPALAGLGVDTAASLLSQVALPRLHALAQQTGETVNLMVRQGTEVRFTETVESPQALRVGSRVGVVLPAAITSGGKVMLCDLGRIELRELYARTSVDLDQLMWQLSQTRRRGYGMNVEESEPGVTAIAVCVRGADGTAIAAISVAAPTVRKTQVRLLDFLPSIRLAAETIRREIIAAQAPRR